MKVTITKGGVLEIEPVNEMETWALKKWQEENLLYNEDLGMMVFKGEKVRIKLEDDE